MDAQPGAPSQSCGALKPSIAKETNVLPPENGSMTPANFACPRLRIVMKNHLFAVVSVFVIFLSTAFAQGPLPLGSVTAPTQLAACPSHFQTGSTCFEAAVSCPNAAGIRATFGVSEPAGIPRGTIVLLSGAGGNEPGLGNYAASYRRAGFRVVQAAWATNWEDTGIAAKSIKAAACRAATLLNYIDQNIYDGNGGMCAQGFSAGSAQVAYSLANYGAGNFLDKVELLSGPVFSDIAEGCEVPLAPPIAICSPGQFGCNGSAWTDKPQYPGGVSQLISTLTGLACQGPGMTSGKENSQWKAMSIVDGTLDSNFRYPQTAVAGWLCSNGLNNSAAQGQLFYRNLGPGQTAQYSLTRIDNCAGPEGVDRGTTPQSVTGFAAITTDMTDPVAGCIKRH